VLAIVEPVYAVDSHQLPAAADSAAVSVVKIPGDDA